jgi:hypothetical protein
MIKKLPKKFLEKILRIDSKKKPEEEMLNLTEAEKEILKENNQITKDLQSGNGHTMTIKPLSSTLTIKDTDEDIE